MFLQKKRCSKKIIFTAKYGNRLYDITSLFKISMEDFRLKNGLINIHVQANTAAILIQENGDSPFKKDLVGFMQNLIQFNPIIQFENENFYNAHLKAALIGPGKTIPVIKGKLALSNSQKIFLCEFDGPNTQREIVITPIRNL